MSYECVLKCGKTCKSSDIISQGKWQSLESKSKRWSGLDMYGDIYSTTSWQDGPANYYMHQGCYISISSSDKVEKSRRRKRKESDIVPSTSQTSSSEMPALCDDETEGLLPAKRLRSSVDGSLIEKTKCVWCLKGEDTKHPNRAKGKLFRINTHSTWLSFKRHTVLIEDEELRDRLSRLVESDTTFRHVDTVIFAEREIRSLQSLLADSKRIVSDYGYPVGEVKSSYIKHLLLNEYQDKIGFQERNAKNKSPWVYDTAGGGDYVEAAMLSLGITDEQLIQNLAPRLSKKIKDTSTVPWPPAVVAHIPLQLLRDGQCKVAMGQ